MFKNNKETSSNYVVESNGSVTLVRIDGNLVGRIRSKAAEVLRPGAATVIFLGGSKATFERFRFLLFRTYGVLIAETSRPLPSITKPPKQMVTIEEGKIP